jgi:hypothetical protein
MNPGEQFHSRCLPGPARVGSCPQSVKGAVGCDLTRPRFKFRLRHAEHISEKALQPFLHARLTAQRAPVSGVIIAAEGPPFSGRSFVMAALSPNTLARMQYCASELGYSMKVIDPVNNTFTLTKDVDRKSVHPTLGAAATTAAVKTAESTVDPSITSAV